MNTHDNMTLQATVEGDGSKTLGGDPQTWSEGFAWLARILILLAIVIAPWVFGSVKYSAQFWITTALLFSLALWWFETALNKRKAQVVPYFAIFLVAGVIIGLIQTIPLSGGMADFLLGRQVELYQEFTQAAGDQESGVIPARASLNSSNTWHQIRLLVMALVTMLLSCRYFRTPRDLTLFFATMAANGTAIAIFGVIQKLTADPGTIFWTVELTLGGSPFGPFVNRNNCGGYMLMCLASAIGLSYLLMSVKKNRGPVPIISSEIPFWRQLSQQILYFVSELTGPKLAAMMAVTFISFGIIASLSRGTVLALLFAVIFTLISYGVAKKPKNVGLMIIPISIAVMLLTVWMGFNNELIERFDKLDSTTEVKKWDARVQTWTDTWASVGEMGKLGSGLGAYDTVSRIYRTDKEIDVFKYAENNFLQSLVDAGWIGFSVYIVAWLFAFYYAYFLLKIGQSPVTVSAGLAGVFLLWGQAFASFFDFGHYIPANLLGVASTLGVISYYAHSMAYRLKHKSFMRFQVPNSFVQGMLVVVFAACVIVGMDLNRKSQVGALRSPNVLTYDNLQQGEADRKISALRRIVTDAPSVDALNELGKLGIHRARLEMYAIFKSEVPVSDSDYDLKNRIWDATSLVRLQEQSELLGRQSKLSRKGFIEQATIQEYLPFAKHWLEESLRLSPMQPEVQITLGEIASILHGIDKGAPYLERAVRIAPTNAVLLLQTGVIYLQAGRFGEAAPHIKKYLELAPKEFDLVMRDVYRHMRSVNESTDDDLILNEMLPDDPELLYRYARQYAEEDSLVKKTALERSEDLLDTLSQSDLSITILRARIKVAMGDYDSAVDYYVKALNSNPNDNKAREELVEVLVEQERFEDAYEHTQDLIRGNDKIPRYRRLLDSIKSRIDEQNNN